ncbi:MAG: hypothetical protein NC191_00620 [Muribaculaceae bacterium]|nr:hypothetical protein [Muribaculaceae bacterium]
MGMAASQARLLTLTARLSDNELRSQTINNAKMRLAAQSSQASEAYINALNNATMKFTNYDETGAAITQPLTFNALTAYSSYNTQYGITNTSGQLLVSENEARMFQNANGDLNKYLKSHGLEYTTTYFEKISNKENPDYPEPFNYITTDQLQAWYEAYGSYENSVEVEKYKTAYSNFNTAKNSLYNGLKNYADTYLGSKGSGADKTDGGYTYVNGHTVAENLSYLKAAYTSKDYNNKDKKYYYENTYNYNNSTTQSFVNGLHGEATQNAMDALMKSYNYTAGNLTVNSTVDIYQNPDLTYSLTVGEVTIIINNDFTVDKVKVSSGYDSNENPNSTADTGLKYIYGGTETSFVNGIFDPRNTDGITGPTITEFLGKFELVEYDEDGTTKIGTTKITNVDTTTMTAKIKETYVEQSAQQGQIERLNRELLDILKNNIDYAKFGKYLLQNQNGLPPAVVTLIENYTNTQNAFLKAIFNDCDTTKYQFAFKEDGSDETKHHEATTINEAIEKSYLKLNDLLDEEYVLWLAKNSNDESGNPLNVGTTFMNENFKTVIKSFIVEQVMEETGTPNYAWVDAMDTTNTGNADAKAQWYTNLFKRMQQGYKTLENGLAASSKWLEYAIESGIVLLEQVDKSFNWQSLEFKTCTRITEETDEAAVAKAEAEYTRAINDIKSKDNMFDIQLKNIDTEHNSLQTEYDSVKKAMDKNIERTFKFSQNG